MTRCCEQIDDYLDGDMSAAESAAWWTAAQNCPECQRVLRRQQELDRLLTAAWRSVQPTTRKVDSDGPAPTETSKFRRRIVAAFALAASVLIAAVVLIHGRSVDRQRPDVSHSQPVETSPELVYALPSARPTVVFSATDIVIPVASEPDFTIVQVMPTIALTSAPHSSEQSTSVEGDPR